MTKFRFPVLLTGLVLALFSLAACGSSSDGEETDGDTSVADGDESEDADTPDGDTEGSPEDGDDEVIPEEETDLPTEEDGDLPTEEEISDQTEDGDLAEEEAPDTEIETEIEEQAEAEAEAEEESEVQVPSCAFSPIVAGETTVDDDEDGFTEEQGDCHDDDNAVNPSLSEIFDGKDNNCDGTIDEGFDEDCDGYKSALVEEGDDCDDEDWRIHPGASDNTGDPVDDNCDGKFGDATTGDDDGDGYAQQGTEGAVVDCDDAEFFTFPGAAHRDSPTACMQDRDNDGYGAAISKVDGGTDCHDLNPNVHPNALEIPDDGVDQDCQANDLVSSTHTGVFVFVDTASGDDTNGGTPEAPKKTIGSALILGNATDKDLIVAEGDYTEAITFIQGRRLYGGFVAGTWTRDPVGHPTRILRPESAVRVLTIDGCTVGMDGFQILAGTIAQTNENQNFETVIITNQGQLELTHSYVHAGTSTTETPGCSLIGIWQDFGCQLKVEESEIDAGSAVNGMTLGISAGRMGYEGSNTSFYLTRSRVYGGSSSNPPRALTIAYMVHAELVGNFLDGGITPGNGDVWTIDASSPCFVLAINNTIYGGHVGGNGRTAAFNNSSQHGGMGADFILINNILEGGHSGYPRAIISHTATRITMIHNNLHTDGSSENCFFGRWTGSSGYYACLNAPEDYNDGTKWAGAENCILTAGNLGQVPGVIGIGANNPHLGPESPMINAGIYPFAYYTGSACALDWDGEVRFQDGHPDLGADEYVD